MHIDINHVILNAEMHVYVSFKIFTTGIYHYDSNLRVAEFIITIMGSIRIYASEVTLFHIYSLLNLLISWYISR